MMMSLMYNHGLVLFALCANNQLLGTCFALLGAILIKLLFGLVVFQVKSDRPTITNRMLRYFERHALVSSEMRNIDKRLIPCGIVIGTNFVAVTYIVGMRDFVPSFEGVIVATKATYHSMQTLEDIVEHAEVGGGMGGETGGGAGTGDDTSVKQCSNVRAFMRVGNYGYFDYTPIDMHLSYTATTSQANIIHQVIDGYRNRRANNTYKVLLHGIAGSGKSTLPKFIAKTMGSVFINSFDPTSPGDSFYIMYKDMCSTEPDKPLVLCVDEYDVIVEKTCGGGGGGGEGGVGTGSGTWVPHQQYPCEIYDKRSHNEFMDRIDHLSNLIVVFTSNKPPEWFRNIDASLIRDRRIDSIFHVDAHGELNRS